MFRKLPQVAIASTAVGARRYSGKGGSYYGNGVIGDIFETGLISVVMFQGVDYYFVM